jgi:hypothetical protein
MKQQVQLPVIIALIVVAVGIVAFIGYKVFAPPPMTATPATNSPIVDVRPATINGKPVPPGVPYDYAVKAGMVKAPEKAPAKPNTK